MRVRIAFVNAFEHYFLQNKKSRRKLNNLMGIEYLSGPTGIGGFDLLFQLFYLIHHPFFE